MTPQHPITKKGDRGGGYEVTIPFAFQSDRSEMGKKTDLFSLLNELVLLPRMQRTCLFR